MSGAGAVAAGSEAAVGAGLRALELGGNAVDAAVAATLAAGVAEPLLTGLGGSGLAMVRMDGHTELCDMFSPMPTAGAAAPSDLDEVTVDFGPTRQIFRVGPASVAVPGLPGGLWALHARHGRLPMAEVAAPAAAVARAGVVVTAPMARVIQLLWPIQQRDRDLVRLLGRDGRPLRAGEHFRNPALGDTIERYAEQGPSLFAEGQVGEAMLRALGSSARITRGDLGAYAPRFTEPVRYSYRDADVWLPAPPSLAGVLVAQALRALEDHGPMPPPLSVRQLRFLCHALSRADVTRKGRLRRHLFSPGFVDGFVTALSPGEVGEEHAHLGRSGPRRPGNTTHISTVDGDGNAVSLTSSLGETCGRMVTGTGVLLNNLLGEDDVNPPDVDLPPGNRLMTMCCPTLLSIGGDTLYALGSSGSSRIRSAILHGVVCLTDHAMHPEEVVGLPRVHVEEGVVHIEIDGRPNGTREALSASPWQFREFAGSNVFFGGLHIAGVSQGRFLGAGDPRRSGDYGERE